MTKSLTGNKHISATAAFITASNPLVLMSASRSIPDILLVLFLTISAWGFIEIMIRENPGKRYYWMAILEQHWPLKPKEFLLRHLPG